MFSGFGSYKGEKKKLLPKSFGYRYFSTSEEFERKMECYLIMYYYIKYFIYGKKINMYNIMAVMTYS